jgi:hypothetical protein
VAAKAGNIRRRIPRNEKLKRLTRREINEEEEKKSGKVMAQQFLSDGSIPLKGNHRYSTRGGKPVRCGLSPPIFSNSYLDGFRQWRLRAGAGLEPVIDLPAGGFDAFSFLN